MKEKIKNRLYLIATIIIMLISLDFVYTYLLSDNHIELCCDCPDFSKHTRHSHSHKYGDEVFYTDPQTSQLRPEVSKDFLLNHSLLITDAYCSKVWQPPKIS